MSRNGVGLYCFSNLSFTPHNAVGNTDVIGAAGAGYYLHLATALGTTGLCPTGTQAYVTVENPNASGANADSSFYILLN